MHDHVFSKTPVRDENGVLSVSRMIKINNERLKEKYNLTNEEYITLLEYDGGLDGLERDSFFAETKYDPDLDPTYVSLSDKILGFAGAVLVFLFYSLLFGSVAFIIFVLPPFVFGYLIERISGHIKNRYIYYAILALTLISLVIIYTMLLTGMRRKSNLWQRESTVAGILCGSVVASTKMAWGGGSSSVLSSALKAALESMCTSSIT